MNVFVTVGTTRFDELFEALYQEKKPNWKLVCQTANPAIFYPEMICFDYANDIDKYIEVADVVVTHAGAGSVYSLLEKNKKLVVVPNLYRIDKHQSDLAEYVHKERYAISCFNMSDLGDCIELARTFQSQKYRKVEFFKGEEISAIINQVLHQ
ncbi:PssE/Cps14G family polysaccharide biosynthesis glycosyltransferase [Bowmanella dokdonensis]|uniref:Glycosyl transferase family 28 C-terminal domain-containing protein n=1 Tax=Bowmanella dokdonensis TaxID=751969 RepID=A0A939DR74_9ALTE|nr:PssE/Cps14G family polysaccharide biosynthesis glycosyltransferase [Bowmanella dokdonensis]MBN7827509.1 hypothetical protein [Bowmanella dokdonensis]